MKKLALSLSMLLLTPLMVSTANATQGGTIALPADTITRSTVQILQYYPDIKMFSPLCTGTVIAEDLVLTAAHCVEVGADGNKPMDDHDVLTVIYFADHINWKAKIDRKRLLKIPFANIKVDPDYTGFLKKNPDDKFVGAIRHDIALIHFSKLLPAGVTPALTLGDLKQIGPVANSSFALGGFGPTKDDMKKATQQLRFTTGELDSPAPGAQLDDDGRLPIKMIKGYNIPGDSGGPAYIQINSRPILVGVLSDVAITGRGPKYSYIEPLATHLGWLRVAAQQLGAKFPDPLP